MSFPDKQTIARIRAEYPVGTRVKLERMLDIQAPHVGTIGVVVGVDDAGSLLMKWSTGSTLSVVYGEDRVRKLTKEEEREHGEV